MFNKPKPVQPNFPDYEADCCGTQHFSKLSTFYVSMI